MVDIIVLYLIVNALTLGVTFLMHREDTAIPRFLAKFIPFGIANCEYCFSFWVSMAIYLLTYLSVFTHLPFHLFWNFYILTSILNAMVVSRVQLVIIDTVRDYAELISLRKAQLIEEIHRSGQVN